MPEGYRGLGSTPCLVIEEEGHSIAEVAEPVSNGSEQLPLDSVYPAMQRIDSAIAWRLRAMDQPGANRELLQQQIRQLEFARSQVELAGAGMLETQRSTEQWLGEAVVSAY